MCAADNDGGAWIFAHWGLWHWQYPHCITDTTPGTPLPPSHLSWSRWGECSVLEFLWLTIARRLTLWRLLDVAPALQSHPAAACCVVRCPGDADPVITRWQLWRGAVWIAHQQQASLWDLQRFPSREAWSPGVICCLIASSIKRALQPVAVCPFYFRHRSAVAQWRGTADGFDPL